MCLGLLRADEWKPPNEHLRAEILRPFRIEGIRLHVGVSVGIAYAPDDAIEPSIANEYRENRKEFEKNAKDWVKRYAK